MITTLNYKKNNFNIIRLFAAIQVVLWHSGEHLLSDTSNYKGFLKILEPFPGVPIFFVISGFLIYSSYERNKSLLKYMKNRCLRLFPGLWFVFIFTAIILYFCGFLGPNLLKKEFWFWTLTQISIFQFYTPDFLKSFGVGNPNGSLWTIFIEFSFYCFLPFLFLVKRRFSRVVVVALLMLISILYNIWYDNTFRFEGIELTNIQKILGLNLIPYLFYFLTGVVLKMYWLELNRFLIGKGGYWLFGYLCYYIVFSIYLEKFEPTYWPNVYGFISTFLLLMATISMAYTWVGNNDILEGRDISYGLYLYHMPIVNLLIHLGYKDNPVIIVLVLLTTVVISSISWFLIEKPALTLK